LTEIEDSEDYPRLRGEALSRFRERAGYTQKQAADLLQVDHMTVSRLERGLTRSPTPGLLRRMLGLYGVNGSDLHDAVLRRSRGGRVREEPVSVPRVSLGLPVRVRDFIARELGDYVRARVPEDAIEEARRFLESSEQFTLWAGGHPGAEESEDELLMELHVLAEIVRRTFIRRGYAVAARPPAL
jgi:transcriptional regulator with XRE-family HTH domain